jgi:hypothetical protein
VELLEEVSVMLNFFIDICSPKLRKSLSHMFDINNVIDFEWHVELPNPLPFTCDEEDENDPNILVCVQTMSIKVSNNVSSTPHPWSYSIYSQNPKNHVYLFFISLQVRMFE